MGVRRAEPRYLVAVKTYLDRVHEVVAPLQVRHGGPVILVQVENEYGAFGDDKTYLRALAEHTRDAGITVPLTTVDQATDEMLRASGLEGPHRTASFGSRAAERPATLRRHQPTGPLMCAEFRNGWFDHWGAHHHTTPAADSAAELDALLTSGANDKGVYQPTTTSYDYDAPLDEVGNPTAKYHAFREVIARHHPVPGEVPPVAPPSPALTAPLGDPRACSTRPGSGGPGGATRPCPPSTRWPARRAWPCSPRASRQPARPCCTSARSATTRRSSSTANPSPGGRSRRSTPPRRRPCGRTPTGPPTSTWTRTAGGRGVVWVNGFRLGRYWSRGPQRTLHVPGPVLRAGDTNWSCSNWAR
ncbi:beta-galactosidase [Actinosynnema sp. NPDC059797]